MRLGARHNTPHTLGIAPKTPAAHKRLAQIGIATIRHSHVPRTTVCAQCPCSIRALLGPEEPLLRHTQLVCLRPIPSSQGAAIDACPIDVNPSNMWGFITTNRRRNYIQFRCCKAGHSWYSPIKKQLERLPRLTFLTVCNSDEGDHHGSSCY